MIGFSTRQQLRFAAGQDGSFQFASKVGRTTTGVSVHQALAGFRISAGGESVLVRGDLVQRAGANLRQVTLEPDVAGGRVCKVPAWPIRIGSTPDGRPVLEISAPENAEVEFAHGGAR